MTVTGRDAETKCGRVVPAEGEGESGSGQIELTLTGDRREVEALSLEIHRLMREHGLEILDMRVRPAHEPPQEDSGGGHSEPVR